MKPVLAAAALIFLALAFYLFPFREIFREVEVMIASLGPAGPFFAAFAYMIATVLLVPGSALTLAAAALFGFKTAFLVVFVGANLGSLCAFLMARTFLREKIVRWAARKPQFRSIDQAIGRRAFAAVLLARLSPALPFNALNYFLGITSVGTRAYAVATLIGILPGMIVYVYLGAAATETLAQGLSGSGNPYQQLLTYAGLLATVMLVVMITRRARKELAQIQGQNGDSLAAVSNKR